MNELLVCTAIVLFACGGLVAGLLGTRPFSDHLYCTWMALAAILGFAGAIRPLFGGAASEIELPWQVPGGAFQVHVDALSALFLLSIFLLSALGACYSLGYFSVREHGGRAVKLRIYYGWVTAGMALLVIAQNSLLFLVGWEVMALAAFMALSVEDHEASVREASLVYLVSTRLGTLAVIGTFALLHAMTGSFSLALTGLDSSSHLGTATFLLGLFGFGIKAGIMPLHVWLPGAHANAPTHVSALMSGVLIKMGIYGLLRLTSFFSMVPIWWGLLVLGLGLLSSVLGVAFALGQHDIKRLLAYHSVENIGIILLGIAVGLVGRAKGEPTLVLLGFGGALLHVVNHGLFKALLFFGAGTVICATKTRNLERLGGLLHKMPVTAFCFLVGAAAIAGLPPLNGFVSEFAVYLGMLSAQVSRLGMSAIALAFALPVLALVGALALACFVKVYAVVFLGEGRTDCTRTATEGPWSMRLPQLVLAAACIVIGLFPGPVLRALRAAIEVTCGRKLFDTGPKFAELGPIHGVLFGLLVLIYFWARRPWASHVSVVSTWDCGYVSPSAKMQYTASSIASDLVGFFAPFLRPETRATPLEGPWPQRSNFNSHVPEVVLELLVWPVLSALGRGATWLRSAQRGTPHVYVLYVLLTLIVMLAMYR